MSAGEVINGFKITPRHATYWMRSSLRRQLRETTDFNLTKEDINHVITLSSEFTQRTIICPNCQTAVSFMAIHPEDTTSMEICAPYFSVCSVCKQKENIPGNQK
jgi:hypothetical protein